MTHDSVLHRAFLMACENVEKFSLTCPAEAYGIDMERWGCSRCTEEITECWTRYFWEKAEEVEARIG